MGIGHRTSIGDRTVQFPLLNGERILAQGYGGVGRKAGGELFVTNVRVLFEPWDLSTVTDLVRWGCKAMQIPHASVVVYVVCKAKTIIDSTAQGVGDIVAVEPIGTASLINPPKIRLTKSDGSVAEFGVVRSPLTPSAHPDNDAVRDNLVAVIRQALL